MKNILLVAGFGGPPIDFALARLKPLGRVHVLYTDTLAAAKVEAIQRLADVAIRCTVKDEDDLAAAVLEAIKAYRIDGVLTLDEFSVGPVAVAARRAELNGAGQYVQLSRNKWQMRSAFEAAGVKNPPFRRVTSLDELRRAVGELRLPAVLKMTEGAMSAGHTIIDVGDDLEAIWMKNTALIERLAAERSFGVVDGLLAPEFILEEMIDADATWWYGDRPFGDLVSVEGLVVNGVYQPIAVTSKYPLVQPFTEIGQITPSILSLDKQQLIVDFARRAVDALKLETCATHTEIKLQADGELCMVESAARTPGALMTRQILEVFDVDMIGCLARALLGEDFNVPGFQHLARNGAAGPVAIITQDSRGVPWERHPKVNKALDLRRYLDPEVEYEIAWSADIENGSRSRAYDPHLGSMNYIANVFLKAPTVDILIQSQRQIMDSAERIFIEQELH
ncbi:ATP-grasp domain-containing protein [Pararhizobium sp. LjRoot235]|uniref:ATP-grasp domain-containing protein n=1 Tax=Pararhizobium sp. LjRoot235 TaxID=3342291 RepID=UPI003ECE1A9B